MKSLRIFTILLIFCVLAGSASPVFAQDYRFQVSDLAVVVTVNKDGSESLDYTMTFVNDSGAHVIDIVDIGMPNGDYDLNSITGEINGVKITKITRSDILAQGISLYLGANEIPAGGTGTVHAYIGKVSNVLYPGTQVDGQDYASLVFNPHYYDPANAHGTTNMQVTLLLPAGMTDQEPRYYTPTGGWPGSDKPESQIMADGRIYYTWVSDQANDYTQYTFGASFPAKYLDAGVIVTKPYEPPTSSSGGGSTTFTSNFDVCGLVFCLGFAGFIGLIIYSATVGAKKRKMEYLPPKISMEGHGIKRGLTAVEAAVLMQQPMDKIFTMILFGLLKKGAAEVVTKEPLELKPSANPPADLYGYETDFLAAFAEKDGPARKRLLQTVMINLIKSIGEKMKGFSQKETLAYYKDIAENAWQQVEASQTPEVKGQVYDENMDWTMLDKNYETRTQQTFSGPVFIPVPAWWWRFDPSMGTASAHPSSTTIPAGTGMGAGMGSVPAPSGGRGSISLPSLPGSTFASSVVNSVSSFSAGVLGDLTAFTGGVTKVTNPPPPPSTYRSGGGFGGGGGHSCACACACAGCACACAGGGR
ncbi:MAG: hypothetical protein ABFD24_05735 [Anaerolineaceae bacterium]